MKRGPQPPSWVALGHALHHTLTARDAAHGLPLDTPEVRSAAEDTLAELRRLVHLRLSRGTIREVARELGCSPATLVTARQPGGWLAE